MATDRKERTPSQPQYQDPAGCIPRLVWMGFGNIALVLAVLSIDEHAGWSIADLAFWLLIGLLIGARYIDIARFQGTRIHGEPATTAHFKRYLMFLLLAGAALFAVARALGPGFR